MPEPIDYQPAEPPAPNDLAQWWGYFRELGWTGVLAVVAATMPIIGLTVISIYLTTIGRWMRAHEELGLVTYIGAFWILGGLSLMPTYIYAALGGWALGFYVGLPAATAGFMGASLIGYVVAVTTSGGRVAHVLEARPVWKQVHDALLRSSAGKTLLITTLLRLSPNSPFALTNLVLGATRVGIGTYLLGTLVGLLPRTAVVLWAASQLQGADPAQVREQSWVWAVGIAVTIVVFIVLSILVRQAIARATRQPDARVN